MDRQEALETYRLLRAHGHDNGALVFADKLAAMMEKESDEAEPFYEMSAEEFEASEEAGGRWRSVEDELPEEVRTVEVKRGGRSKVVEGYHKSAKWWNRGGTGTIPGVTHWRYPQK